MAEIPEEIGRHFIVGLSGPSLTDEEQDLLRALKPLGVILRAHNFSSTKSYEGWLNDLSELEERVHASLPRAAAVIALDHEGGRVFRTPPPITHFPYARDYCLRAREVAHAMGTELRSLGINLSFAPVADINSNPNNPVIGPRAFSSDSREVARAVAEFTKGLMDEQIVPVAKHFPGHGDTSQDSHEELPSIERPLESIRNTELLPFRAAVEAQVPALLSAHILFPLVDADFPATLSPLLLRQLAREHLGFKGVLISDDLDMKAITDNYSDEEVALRAPIAGCDILLFNHDPARALRIAQLTQQLLDDGQLDGDEFFASSARIQHFLQTHVRLHVPHRLSEELLARHAGLRGQLPPSKEESSKG